MKKEFYYDNDELFDKLLNKLHTSTQKHLLFWQEDEDCGVFSPHNRAIGFGIRVVTADADLNPKKIQVIIAKDGENLAKNFVEESTKQTTWLALNQLIHTVQESRNAADAAINNMIQELQRLGMM
jgi:hypothetical protein